MQNNMPIICDSGTGYMKIGYAGDTFPRATFPALLGRPMLRYQQTIDDVQLKQIMIGQQAQKYRSLLQLSHPTTQAIITSKEDLALLLGYSFDKIGCHQTKGKSILLTQAVNNPLKNRETFTQMIFEKFQFRKMTFGIQAIMSLYATGRQSAFLLDSGDGVTHGIPIFQSFILKNNVGKLNIAGSHVTNQLIKLMLRRGYAFNSSADFELIRELKQKYCFASGDLKLDLKLAQQTTYHQVTHVLPDNTKIKLGRERFQAPEILFNPYLAGLEVCGTSQMVFNCIEDTPMDNRPIFFKNILISGGTSMLPGFPTRLKEDIRKLFISKKLKGKAQSFKKSNVQILDPQNRKYYVFIGSSLFGKTMMPLQQFWVSKQKYEQQGFRCLKKLKQ